MINVIHVVRSVLKPTLFGITIAQIELLLNSEGHFLLLFSSARAEAYKEDGNYEYKRKNFKEAIAAYTEGIKIKCDDAGLNAILYTNRATAQFCLGISQIIIHHFVSSCLWHGLTLDSR